MWSPNRDLNPRPHPYQGCALPLSYSGFKCKTKALFKIYGAGDETRTRNIQLGRLTLYH